MNEDLQGDARSPEEWADGVEERLFNKQLRPLEFAQRALRRYPEAAPLLELAAFAAVVEEQPELALRYLKKLERLYFPLPSFHVCRALALAQLGKWPQARSLLDNAAVPESFLHEFCPEGMDWKWARQQIQTILRWKPKVADSIRSRNARLLPRNRPEAVAAGLASQVEDGVPPLSPLPRHVPKIAIRFALPDATSYDILDGSDSGSAGDFILRLDLAHASLFQTFDDLLCLPHLRGVDHYWYQIETARKVLKQFHGRVLLGDEVGLGKTVEAGMILKEYMLRGMAERILILTPASLVGQWREEMESKFGLEFITSQDSLLRRDATAFWGHPRVIASIAAARLETNAALLLQLQFDLIIVDEAQHLKNRSSKNWQLIDGLQKRFLLLLSATPIQNSLLELYNLLTLLKPGIFKTEKEFRSIYVTPGNPRVPANRERLQELMRDVMIRNTRALVDVRLPRRHAVTVMVEPSSEELDCYQELSRHIRSLPENQRVVNRMALHQLLEGAGSSPRAAAAALAHFLKTDSTSEWQELSARYGRLAGGAKADALASLLARNPSEKKIVFARFRETLHMLGEVLRGREIPFACFEGSLSGAEKDREIARFRDEVPVLLSTESGGEGRNLQFCNTLINFDLPWNPQLIEQRIGRIHRIGQTREVFVFNLAVKHTAEAHILRILDEKIHMFELVIGELQSILGEMEEGQSFANLVFSAWVAQTEECRQSAFDRLSDQLAAAKQEYETTKALDEEVFGEEFGVA